MPAVSPWAFNGSDEQPLSSATVHILDRNSHGPRDLGFEREFFEKAEERPTLVPRHACRLIDNVVPITCNRRNRRAEFQFLDVREYF